MADRDKNVDFIFEIMESGSCLREAVNNADTDNVKILLETGQFDGHDKDSGGRTLLYVPVCRGQARLVRLLLDHGADARATDNNGSTPLHWCGSEDVLELLVYYGADINKRNKLGLTPKEMATRRGVTQSIIDVFSHLEKQSDQQREGLNTLDSYYSLVREFSDTIGVRNLCLLIAGIMLLSLQFAYIITGASKHLEVLEPASVTGL